MRHKVVTQEDGGDWVVTRDLHRYTLRDLYQDCEPTVPWPQDVSAATSSQAYLAAIGQVGGCLEEAFGRALASYFEPLPSPQMKQKNGVPEP